jgi:hypothetical protein
MKNLGEIQQKPKMSLEMSLEMSLAKIVPCIERTPDEFDEFGDEFR